MNKLYYLCTRMRIKQIIAACFLLVILFTHSLTVNVLYALYSFDQDVFIELFCENKEKPELHCDGNCMLSKIDGQHSADQEQIVLFEKLSLQLNYIFELPQYNILNIHLQKVVKSVFNYQDNYKYLYPINIFHPPSL